jgi:hypothetical protein
VGNHEERERERGGSAQGLGDGVDMRDSSIEVVQDRAMESDV